MATLPEPPQVFQHIESLRGVYQFRGVIRYGQDNHVPPFPVESSVEHRMHSMFLTHLFHPMENGDLRGINLHKVTAMLLFHDLPEIGKKGDIPQTMKTEADEVMSDHEVDEFRALLPQELWHHAESALSEFEACETIDARFALALDKLEPTFAVYFDGISRLVPPQAQCIPPGAWHGWIPDSRRRATREFPVMHHYGEVIGSHIEQQLEAHRPSWAAE